jgi:hypothetical protein
VAEKSPGAGVGVGSGVAETSGAASEPADASKGSGVLSAWRTFARRGNNGLQRAAVVQLQNMVKQNEDAKHCANAQQIEQNYKKDGNGFFGA